MKQNKRGDYRGLVAAVLALSLMLWFGSCRLASAQNVTDATDVQEGTIGVSACDTTDLPANIWTLVRYDNAGEPCATHASQLGGSCTPNTWNWMVDGHFAFTQAPGHKVVRVRVQVWAGGGGGACHSDGQPGGSVLCDNPAYKTLKQDETYISDKPGNDLAVPFTSLQYLLAPYFETPADANYQGLWIFAYPIGRPAVCRTISFHDLGAN